MQRNNYPLVRLPYDVQMTLLLIREELKSRKLFHAFHKIGLDDCYFQPHLDSLILRTLDMDEDCDKTFSAYNDIMEKRSRKIEADNDSIMKQALKVYHELLHVKKELSMKRASG